MLEKVVSYARNTQQIFVAQCLWWLASIIGPEQGKVTHIDNHMEWSDTMIDEVLWPVINLHYKIQCDRSVSSTPRDIQEDPQLGPNRNFIHPKCMAQLDNTLPDIMVFNLKAGEQIEPLRIVDTTKQFSRKAYKER
jgi:hypothetical protein